MTARKKERQRDIEETTKERWNKGYRDVVRNKITIEENTVVRVKSISSIKRFRETDRKEWRERKKRRSIKMGQRKHESFVRQKTGSQIERETHKTKRRCESQWTLKS